MITRAIGAACKRVIDAIVRTLAKAPFITPNVLTVVGLLINICSAILYGLGYFIEGGLVLIFANLFDMLDGSVARLQGRVTRFGAFFDSVMDRYSDTIVLIGIMVFYARDTVHHSTLYVALTGVVLIGSVLISYTRARAEGVGIECKVGFLERPERVVLIIIGSLTEVTPETYAWVSSHVHQLAAELMFYKMRAVMWVMAVLSHWTVVHRVYHTYLEFQRVEGPDSSNPGTEATRPEQVEAAGEVVGAGEQQLG